MRKHSILTFLQVALITSLVFIPVFTSLAVNGTEVVVINPDTSDSNFIFYTNTTAVGTRFNATVWIYDVTDMFAYQVLLSIDDTLLNITNAWIPFWDSNWPFFGQSSIRPSPAFRDNNFNGVIEAVLVGDSLLIGTPFTGSGLLAIIEFEIISAPTLGSVSCALDIDYLDTYALDYDLFEITTTKTSGYYEYIGPPAPPIPTATIFVDPDRIIDPTLVACNYFQVTVSIANATDVYSFAFKLSYEPAVLTVENATLGAFFPPTVVPVVTIDNSAGYVDFSASLSSPDPPISGDGVLAVITFHVEDLGGTDLHLYDVDLRSESDDALPFTTEDSFFSNVLLAKMYIDPSELIEPWLMPGVIFEVDVVIDDVEELYGYEFTLGYNTHMLTCIGIIIHPILNETNFTVEMQLSDMAGSIWTKVDYHPPATPITTYTPQSIVTLTFMVDNIGDSVLDLQDTSMTDPADNPITHEAIDGYVMTLIRDVAVINVVTSDTWVYESFPVNITATVKNKGNVTETFDVTVYYDSTLIDSQTVVDLNPNEERILSFVWDTTGVAGGNYTIKAEASQVPDEFDIINNTYVDGSVEIRELIRDVAIIYLSAEPSIIYAGQPVNVTVTAKNKGNLTETFGVTIYYDSNTMATFPVVDLPPNGEITFVHAWNTTGLPECSNFTISAEASTVPFETNTADNIMVDGWVKIKILGDINNDGKVDIKDVAIVAAAFGSYPWHERWNPDADLNDDGRVDIKDVAMVASNFGRTC